MFWGNKNKNTATSNANNQAESDDNDYWDDDNFVDDHPSSNDERESGSDGGVWDDVEELAVPKLPLAANDYNDDDVVAAGDGFVDEDNGADGSSGTGTGSGTSSDEDSSDDGDEDSSSSSIDENENESSSSLSLEDVDIRAGGGESSSSSLSGAPSGEEDDYKTPGEQSKPGDTKRDRSISAEPPGFSFRNTTTNTNHTIGSKTGDLPLLGYAVSSLVFFVATWARKGDYSGGGGESMDPSGDIVLDNYYVDGDYDYGYSCGSHYGGGYLIESHFGYALSLGILGTLVPCGILVPARWKLRGKSNERRNSNSNSNNDDGTTNPQHRHPPPPPGVSVADIEAGSDSGSDSDEGGGTSAKKSKDGSGETSTVSGGPATGAQNDNNNNNSPPPPLWEASGSNNTRNQNDETEGDTDKLSDCLEKYRWWINLFLLVWALAGWGFFTFAGGDVFGFTGNGYFALWAMLFFGLGNCGVTTDTLAEELENADSYIYGLVLASAIVLVELTTDSVVRTRGWAFRANAGVSTYALVVAVLSLVLGLVVAALSRFAPDNKYKKALSDPKTRMGCSGVFVVLWIVAASLTTFIGPFLVTGNGYFAVWAATICAASAFFDAKSESEEKEEEKRRNQLQ